MAAPQYDAAGATGGAVDENAVLPGESAVAKVAPMRFVVEITPAAREAPRPPVGTGRGAGETPAEDVATTFPTAARTLVVTDPGKGPGNVLVRSTAEP